MAHEIELVSDGDGLSVLGSAADVERFFLESGLDRVPSSELDTHRLWSTIGAGGTAVQAGTEVMANSGRWVKVTAESAEAIRKYGLMPTKTQGVSHAMIGQPGDIKQWIQIAQAPTTLLSGPLALATLSTMMQQRAMQEQMDDIVEYLQEISEKVDDILRAQKDAALADMIGVDLTIEEAFTIRDHVGHVTEITWSKVQATGMTIARTQAYALRQLDAIAEKLERKSDLGDIAKATKEAEPRIREWLAVIARTFQLQEGASILELDHVLDTSPSTLKNHRLGIRAARQNRVDLIGRTTARLLAQMNQTIARANAKVLLNPFDSPAAVKSSNQVADCVVDFRERLSIETEHDSQNAKRWGRAAVEVGEKVVSSATDGAAATARLGATALDRAAEPFRAIDTDGDGVADRRRAAVAAEEARSSLRHAANGVAGAFGTLFSRKSADPEVPELLDADDDASDGKP